MVLLMKWYGNDDFQIVRIWVNGKVESDPDSDNLTKAEQKRMVDMLEDFLETKVFYD